MNVPPSEPRDSGLGAARVELYRIREVCAWTNPGPGMNLGDFLYVLFRHKGKIAVICCLALAAAYGVRRVVPRIYESDAKLYVRYVLESGSPGETTGPADGRIRLPESRGDTIMNTEIEVLKNFSVAQDVAKVIGPEKILGMPPSQADPDKAALAVAKSLSVEVPRSTTVLHLTFRHLNPKIVEPALQQVIEAYFRKHTAIHAVGALDEALNRETEERRTRLERTREELRQAKEKLGVTSLSEARTAYNSEMSKLREQISSSQAELAEHEATLNEMTKRLPAPTPALTNTVPAVQSPLSVPAEQLAKYRDVVSLLDALQRRELELLLVYTPENSLVHEVRHRIDEKGLVKKQLELENPGLLAAHVVPTTPASAPSGLPLQQQPDPALEAARVVAIRSRVAALTNSLGALHRQVDALNDAEGTLSELQTRLELEEAQFKRFSERQDQSKTEERIGAGRVFNISVIQGPSPAVRAPSERINMVAGVLFGGVAAALGLAFLIEFYLDRSVRRPADVETKLKLPLFLSIPYLCLNGKGHRPAREGRGPLLAEHAGSGGATDTHDGRSSDSIDEIAPPLKPGGMEGRKEPAAWHPASALKPFTEVLRDRVIAFFEMAEMRHKPKLVGITACREGAGVSTLAAGLAASLSETGEGNVLLVNLSQVGYAQHFTKGGLACDLDDALLKDKRNLALGQGNLYVVDQSKPGQVLPSLMPNQFKHLVPKLKASDYDFIIFDMPPVSQISTTLRLAQFMDMMLLVAESERTHQDAMGRAADLLKKAQRNVGVILNKHRSYVPARLHQEL